MAPPLLALLAAAVAAAAAAGTYRLSRRREGGTPAGPALAAGVVAAFVVVGGLPKGLPAEAWQWLPPFALLAGGLGLVPDPWGRRAVVPALALGLVLATVPERTFVAVGGLLLGFLALAEVVRGAALRAGPRPLLAALAVAAAGTAASLVVSGWMLLGQAAGGLAAAAGAVFLLAGRSPASAGSAVAAGTLLLGGLLLDGSLYAELPRASAVLLAGALLGAWIPFRSSIARVGAVALLAAAAVAVALAASPPMDY
jgi:hypothetical protein